MSNPSVRGGPGEAPLSMPECYGKYHKMFSSICMCCDLKLLCCSEDMHSNSPWGG